MCGDDSMTWLVGFVAFVLFSTRNEFADVDAGSGLAFLLRLIAFAIFLVVGFLRCSKAPSAQQVTFAVGIALVILASNIIDLRPFVFMAMLAIVMGAIFPAIYSLENRWRTVSFLSAYIILNIVSIAGAVLYYEATGSFYDIHAALFPWSVSRAGEFIGVARLSGIQVEPGTYANAVFATVFLKALLERRISTPLNAAAMVSTLFSNSAWSLIGVSGFFAASLFENVTGRTNAIRGQSYALKIAALVTICIAVVIYLGDVTTTSYFSKRFSLEAGAGSGIYKAEALTAWWSELQGLAIFFPRAMSDSFCTFCISVQDIGVGFNLIYYFGALLAVPLFAVLIYLSLAKFGAQYIILLITFMATKYYYYDMVVWMIFGCILFLPNKKIRTADKFTSGSIGIQ